MKEVVSFIFKYLAFALFIIVAMMYMDGFEFQRQAGILLLGIMAIDLVFSIVAALRRGVDRGRKKRSDKLKQTAKEAKELKKETKALKKETRELKKRAEKAESAELAVALPDPENKDAWSAIKEKGAAISSAIIEKFTGEQEED